MRIIIKNNGDWTKNHCQDIHRATTVYAIYFASLIFRESGLQDISASGEIRDRGGEQSWTDVGEISIIHSFARALCTVL